MRRSVIIALLIVASGGAALADPLGGRAARKLMFPPEGAQSRAIPQPFLSDDDLDLINQVAVTQPYYGAVALSPSEGLRSAATVAAANYHDLEHARIAALAECDALKKPASEACVIVSEITPEGYAPRALQLSASATQALSREYRKGRGPKALAISASTGKWAVAKGAGAAAAAVASCAQAAGAGDCVAVVQD